MEEPTGQSKEGMAVHPHWALLLLEPSIYYILYRLKRRRDNIGMRLPVSPELPCNQMTQALLLFYLSIGYTLDGEFHIWVGLSYII